MKSYEYADCLIVVNGPEDGTEFPLVRGPVQIGRSPSCAVNIRLDENVRDVHALVTAVSDGYRVRRLAEAPVYVDGRRAGMFWSRIVRSGGYLQVGQTLLALECAPDGLASRSLGLASENDVAWTLRQLVKGSWRLALGVIRFVLRVAGPRFGKWALFAIVFGALYVLWPAFHNVVWRTYWAIYYQVRPLIPW